MAGCPMTGGRRKSFRKKSHRKKSFRKKNKSLLSQGTQFVGSVFSSVNRSGNKLLRKTGKFRKRIIGMR